MPCMCLAWVYAYCTHTDSWQTQLRNRLIFVPTNNMERVTSLSCSLSRKPNLLTSEWCVTISIRIYRNFCTATWARNCLIIIVIILDLCVRVRTREKEKFVVYSHFQLVFLFRYNSQSHQHNHFPYNAIATFYSSPYTTMNYMYTKCAVSVMIMIAMCDDNDDDEHTVASTLKFTFSSGGTSSWFLADAIATNGCRCFFWLNCSAYMLYIVAQNGFSSTTVLPLTLHRISISKSKKRERVPPI